MDDTYTLLGLDPSDTTTLDSYLDDYFGRILKKLKEVSAISQVPLSVYFQLLFLHPSP